MPVRPLTRWDGDDADVGGCRRGPAHDGHGGEPDKLTGAQETARPSPAARRAPRDRGGPKRHHGASAGKIGLHRRASIARCAATPAGPAGPRGCALTCADRAGRAGRSPEKALLRCARRIRRPSGQLLQQGRREAHPDMPAARAVARSCSRCRAVEVNVNGVVRDPPRSSCTPCGSRPPDRRHQAARKAPRLNDGRIRRSDPRPGQGSRARANRRTNHECATCDVN